VFLRVRQCTLVRRIGLRLSSELCTLDRVARMISHGPSVSAACTSPWEGRVGARAYRAAPSSNSDRSLFRGTRVVSRRCAMLNSAATGSHAAYTSSGLQGEELHPQVWCTASVQVQICSLRGDLSPFDRVVRRCCDKSGACVSAVRCNPGSTFLLGC